MDSKNLGMTAEERVAKKIRAIEDALGKALDEAAGEPMAYILLVAPTGRSGEHLFTSNIADDAVIVGFLREAAQCIQKNFRGAQERFRAICRKGLNS